MLITNNAEIEAEWERCKTTNNYAAFKEFHFSNRGVFNLIETFADELIARGKQQWGIANLCERVRWEVGINTDSVSEFKMPNNHRAYYARLWLMEHRTHLGFFNLSEMRSLSRRHNTDDPERSAP